MVAALSQFASPQIDEANVALAGVVGAGAAALGTAKESVAAIEAVEKTRRLAAVATVDVLAEITNSRSFYEHGHTNARVMFQHVAGVSGSEAHRFDQIRRMLAEAAQINCEWRDGRLSVDKASLIGRAFANPRTRERFLLDQRWFIKQARRFGMVRFTKVVARWLEVNDVDGPEPKNDPTLEKRNAWLVQEQFTKGWRFEADLGSVQGSEVNQIFKAYVKAEFNHDWSQAEKLHGANVCTDLLARSHAQRSADAFCQIFADACNSDKPSAPVKKVHNIVWTAEAWEEQVRRYVGAAARVLDPGSYNVTDIDGHPLFATAAFADSLVGTIRRVVQNAAGVTIDMSEEHRLFTGLARLGVQLQTPECYWPGCHVPTSQCHIDHLKPAACGGQTNQLNGLPACPRHNWFKERGYTVTRDTDGEITITTPTGDTIG